MTIDAPLSFGQLSTWRSMQTFAPDRLFEVNVPALWDLDGVDTPTVLAAWCRLLARHEALRTTYHELDGQPVQRIHPSLPPLLEVREGAERTEVPAQLAALCLPISGDRGWRGVLGTEHGRPRFLALTLSHMVLDLWSVTELETQFRTLCAGSDPGPEKAPTPRELALLQHGEAWAARRRSTEKYWRRLLGEGPVRNLPPSPPGPQTRIQATLRSPALAVLGARAAADIGVSVQSLLLGLTASALARTLGRERVMLSVMSANRFDQRWQPLVSTMNQLVPLVVAPDPHATIAAYLKRIHLNVLLAYRHGCYDVDLATGWAEQAAAGFEHDCWFNYVTETPVTETAVTETPVTESTVTGGTAALPPATCTWTPPRRQAGHPFYARVNSDGRTWTDLSIRADPRLLPEDAVLGLLRLVALGVHRAATSPESLVGKLTDTAEVPGTLFP